MREEIQRKFEEIASRAAIPEIGQLVRELGILMQQRFNDATDATVAINSEIVALHNEFQALSHLLTTRLKDTERVNGDQMARVIDRVHNLGGRFMAVEEKVNEAVALFDLQFERLLDKLNININAKRDRSNTTTD